MLSPFAQEILGQLKKSTVSRNARRSHTWLFNKIKDEAKKKVDTPKVGRMYLYVYDAKHKATLPYWDVNPLIIMIGPAKDGFYGINFHYLPIRERLELLELIVPFQKLVSAKTQKEININYKKLLGLSKTYWKHCFKHYLVGQLNTRLIEIPMTDWINTVGLPLAHFKGATSQEVWRDR
jgi:hypothetical protein